MKGMNVTRADSGLQVDENAVSALHSKEGSAHFLLVATQFVDTNDE